VVLGHQVMEANIRQGHPGVAVVTPITAALNAFAALWVKRISLITPYLESVTRPVAEYIQSCGYSVASAASFGIADEITMARLSPTAIQAAALRHCAADADALFISCTAIRAAETVAALEAELGKPVLTSIQCLFWAALRPAGYRSALHGHGQLLQEAW
jgi:maleate isomerase